MRSPRKLIKEMWTDLLASRELAWRLAVRDTNAQYRASFLGYIWAFLLPLVNTLTWIFLNASGIVRIADTGLPYPVYVFTGTMLWQIFTEALQSPLNEIGAAKAMLAKLNFPRESLILSGILKSLLNAGIKITLLVPGIMILGIYPDWHLLLFPFAVLSIILVGNIIGLFLSPIGVLYSDIGKSIPILTQFLMFVTPVVFAMPEEGLSATIFQYNFMTPLIMTARDWLTGSGTEWLFYFLMVNGVAIIVLMVAWIIYKITMPIIIERMSA